jgi:hypothetical protein
MKGKKTYIIGACSILFAITGVVIGQHDYNAAIQMIQAAVLAMTVRHGVG